MSEKLITWLVISFIVLTLGIGAAAIFMPSTSEAATVIGLIIGGYVSILTGAGVGAAVTRQVRKHNNNEEGDE